MTEAAELSMAEKLALLPLASRGTEMGRLLRTFWHPVARSKTVAAGEARALRAFGEDLTLYRGTSGRAYLVGGRCAHRLTVLHTGTIEGDELRCMYHGWKYDGTGQCVERPAEEDVGLPNVKIAGYPVHEYSGLVFAYLGNGAPPEFDLPRKDAFEAPGTVLLVKEETWPCNWLQAVENSLDALHVSFVHRTGAVGTFGEAVTAKLPKLEYFETASGIRQIATRGKTNVRVSDWTFPNNNHILQPTFSADDPWMHIGQWNVPVDDEHTTKFVIYARESAGEAEDRRFIDYFEKNAENYDSSTLHDQLFHQHKYPEDHFAQLTSAQDYVAQVGQGAIVDRTQERLGKSDAGIVLLRRIYWREARRASPRAQGEAMDPS